MSNISIKYDQIASYVNKCNSAPAGEVVTALAKESSLGHPKAFTKIESALSSGSVIFTAPFHVLRNLFLAGIAAPFSKLSPTAKTFAINRIMTTGIDFASLFAGLAGIVYPFTPGPEMVKKNLPKLSDISNGVQSAVSRITKENSNDKILRIGDWFERNKELAKEVFQEISQLKPLIPLLPHAKLILEEILTLTNEDNIRSKIAGLQQLNTAPFVGIILATLKNHATKQHGKIFTKLDSATSFGTVGLTAPLHMITHLFLTIISAPFALFSSSSKSFCATQLFKLKLSFACFVIGLIGLFNPNRAEKFFKNLTINYLPAKWREPARNLWNSALKLSENDIKNIAESFSVERLKAQVSSVLPRLIQLSQNHPEGIEQLIELANLVGVELPENLSATAVPLLKEVAALENKHPGVIQGVTEIVMNKDWNQIPQLLEKHPDLPKDIAVAIEQKPELTQAIIDMPVVKNALPPELIRDIPNIVKDGAKIAQEYPTILADLAKLPENETQLNRQNIEEVAKKYPGLEEKIQNFMDTYPELERMLSDIRISESEIGSALESM